jgi:hypothetical protein
MPRSGNTTTLTNGSVNVEATAFAELLNGGFIDILDGPQPASADHPITVQKVGATLTFGDPAFKPAVVGTIISNRIEPALVKAGFAPSWARMYTADHRAVMDISVGVRDANLIIPAEYLEKGATLSCDSYTHTIAKRLI